MRILVLMLILLAGVACSSNRSAGKPESAAAFGQRTDQAAGIQWRVPTQWQVESARPMRVVGYRIAPVKGDPEQAECAVYFFGTGQGGTVEANLERWSGQFAQADGRPASPQLGQRTVAGLAVHSISTSGTYLAANGPMSTVSETKPNFAMLGAIVEAPQGLVFFKLIGPAKTVASARLDFDSVLGSLRTL
jgi:hypothetical protein